MAKKKPTSDPKAETTARIKRTESYAEKVRLMFAATVSQILALNKTIPPLKPGEMFSFDSQSLKKQNEVERLLRQLHSVATMAIQQGVTLEWGQANAAADTLVKSIFGQEVLSSPEFKAWGSRNGAAMKAFINRSEKGLNLSDRVWQAVRQLRDEMEVAITVSIGEGESSQKMSQAVRKYLNDPDLMFRRFRYKAGEEPILDEDGNEIGKKIIWGKKWKKRIKKPHGTYGWIDYDRDSYKTGAGVYKSSAKNAMRVARTETNIAYRRADHERWQAMDFVLGQRISMSKDHPKKDICDKLAGDYPKDFVFDGWHPQCFCYVTPITIPPEETAKLTEMMLNGEDWRGELARLKRGREITSYPDNFKQWVTDNAGNIHAARDRGTEPYFIRNNARAVDNIINPPKALTPQEIAAQIQTTRTPLEIAKERHAARTPEDVERIQTEWNRHRYLNTIKCVDQLDLYGESQYQELCRLIEDDIDLGEQESFEHNFADLKRMISDAREREYGATERLMLTPLFMANNIALVAGFGARGMAMPFRPANELRGNPHYAESEGYRVNCQTCVVANELRRRGFDIEALANTKGSALEKLSHHTESAWLDSNGNIPTSHVSGASEIKRKRWDGTEYKVWKKTSKNRKQMVAALESDISEDGRYHIKWTWNDGKSGHIITGERIDGKLRYYDPQNGKIVTDFVAYIDDIKLDRGIRWLRVDNLRVNPNVAKNVLTKPTSGAKSGKPSSGGMKGTTKLTISGDIKTDVANYIKLRNSTSTNREKVALDMDLIRNGRFILSHHHSTTKGSIFATEELPKKISNDDHELSKNIQMAKKMADNGYDCYLLSNPHGTKSADFIFVKGGKVYYTEGKLSTGKNSLDHNLLKGKTQAERVLIDLTGTNDTKYITSQLLKAFKKNENLIEVKLLKGGREISITRQDVSNKNFAQKFKQHWEQRK